MATLRSAGYVPTAAVWNALFASINDAGTIWSGAVNGSTGQFSGGVGVGATPAAAYTVKGYLDNASVGAATGVYLEQDGAGDLAIGFLLTGTIQWLAGIDNSDSDAFWISNITGGSDFAPVGLRIDATGSVRVVGSEGSDAGLSLWADNGDDSADKWSIVSSASGSLVVLQDATTYLTLNSGGLSNALRYNSGAAQPGFLAYNDVGDTITVVGPTTVEFDLEAYDDASNYSTSTDTFTAPVAGRYFLSASVTVINNEGSSRDHSIRFALSVGGDFYFGAASIPAGLGHTFSGSIAVNLALGETVSIVLTPGGAGTPNYTINGLSGSDPTTWFSARLLA